LNRNNLIIILGPIGYGFSALTLLLIARHLGIGEKTDLFLLAISLPTIISGIVNQCINTIALSYIAQVRINKSKDAYADIHTTVIIVSVLITMILVVSTELWIALIAFGLDADQRDELAYLCRIASIICLFSGLSALTSARYTANGESIAAELPFVIASSAIMIAVIAMPSDATVTTMLMIYVSKSVIQFVLTIRVADFKRTEKFQLGNVQTLVNDMYNQLLFGIYQKVNPVIVRALLSGSAPGTLTSYLLLEQIFDLLAKVIEKSVQLRIFYHLHIESVAKRWSTFRTKLHGLLLMSAIAGLLVIVMTLYLVLSALPWLLFGDLFTISKDLSLGPVKEIAFALALNLQFGILTHVLIQGLYAVGNMRTPMLLSSAFVTLTIPSTVIAFWYYDASGVASVTCFVGLLSLMTHFWIVRTMIERNLSDRV